MKSSLQRTVFILCNTGCENATHHGPIGYCSMDVSEAYSTSYQWRLSLY